MKSISIDLETRSSVDISKSGVYRYTEAEDFAILLFGYSVDGGAVEVIDLANGDRIPKEILDALTDDNIIKWAFNANFERVCLSRYLSDLGIDLDPCIKERSTKVTHGIRFIYQGGMMFIELPSGRRLAYVKPRIGENQFGGESITYMGLDLSKKWARIESYGPKLVENITQAISRDILCYAMQTLRTMDIVAHVHDELIIECDERISLPVICEQMARTPPWAEGLLLRADGFACKFYQKD